MFVMAVDQRHKSRTSNLVDNIINAKRNERRANNENAIKKALSGGAAENSPADEEK